MRDRPLRGSMQLCDGRDLLSRRCWDAFSAVWARARRWRSSRRIPTGRAATPSSRSRRASARATTRSGRTSRQQHPGEPARPRGRLPVQAGQPISPAIEDATQPACTPITGWRFTLGKGSREVRSRARGARSRWSARRSRPTSPRSPRSRPRQQGPDPAGHLDRWGDDDRAQRRPGQAGREVELAVDPGRDDDRSGARGRPGVRGSVRLRGAALRDRQPQRRQRRVDPVPVRQSHVYCYAYYVTPPPTSGTIVIRKQVSDPPNARPDLHVPGQHLLHARRDLPADRQRRERGLADVLPRRDGPG